MLGPESNSFSFLSLVILWVCTDCCDSHDSRLSHLLDLSAEICWIFSQKGPQLLLCLVISHSPGMNKEHPGKALGRIELTKVAEKEDKPQNVQRVYKNLGKQWIMMDDIAVHNLVTCSLQCF